MFEITQKRTYNAKHFDNGDGTYSTQSHVGHIHYKDTDGVFVDSDFSPVDQGTYWEMTKHNYTLRIAKDFAAPLLMQFTNKYEGANHTITYEPFSLAWYDSATNDVQQFRAQQSVQGVYNATKNSFYYTGAFGAGIDFEITIQRSGFRKEIVIPNKPGAFPTPPTVNHRLVALFKYGGTGLTIADRADGTIWNMVAHKESNAGFEIREANPLLKSFIQPAYGVDADGRRTSLKVMWRLRNGQLWQIKEIPLDKLAQATFPVRFDTTTSYYAGAGDGYVLGFTNTSPGTQAAWDNVHDSSSPSSNVTSATDTSSDTGWRLQSQVASNGTQIGRLFFPIDTSAIGSGATVTAATFNYWGNCSLFANNHAHALVQTNQASTSTVAVGDFDLCGDAINNPTEGATRISFTGTTTAAYNTFTLNATGLGWVNVTGFTKLGIRSDKDCDDTYATYGDNRFTNYYSEATGTANDPYIEVTYSPATVSTNRQRHTLLTLGVG